MQPKINSSTKGANLQKVGHTTNNKYGNSIHKKANHNPKEVGPKG